MFGHRYRNVASFEADSLSVTHRDGDRWFFVAFLEVDIFLSAILSIERFFNGVCEQKAPSNQRREVKG